MKVCVCDVHRKIHVGLKSVHHFCVNHFVISIEKTAFGVSSRSVEWLAVVGRECGVEVGVVILTPHR